MPSATCTHAHLILPAYSHCSLDLKHVILDYEKLKAFIRILHIAVKNKDVQCYSPVLRPLLCFHEMHA